MDYYKTLGVSKSASDQDIKAAFRKKAMEYHPDKNPGNEKAEDMFKQVNNAYSILSDPQKRRMYDMGIDPNQNRGPGGPGGFGGRGNFEDLFSHFNMGFGRPGGQESSRPKVINTIIKINLYESIFGVEKNIKFNYKSPCDVCSGSGAKEFRTCEACNGSGMRTMQHGPHSNIMMTCNACGGSGKIMKEKCDKCGGTGLGEVKTREHTINIRPGTTSGENIIMHGGGIPDGHGGFGHLVINIEIEFPAVSSFSSEDKEILRKLLN